jgi:hypothetical protein
MLGLEKKEDGSFFWTGHSTRNFENTADIVTDKAIRWLAKQENRPFFMMVHYFDPHHDYAPPERFGKAFPDPYSGEVAFTDEQLGLIMRELDALGLSRRSSRRGSRPLCPGSGNRGQAEVPGLSLRVRLLPCAQS